MTAGWIALAALLAGALAAIALLRSRMRPAVEAGPKASGHAQADPAALGMVEEHQPSDEAATSRSTAPAKESDRRAGPSR